MDGMHAALLRFAAARRARNNITGNLHSITVRESAVPQTVLGAAALSPLPPLHAVACDVASAFDSIRQDAAVTVSIIFSCRVDVRLTLFHMQVLEEVLGPDAPFPGALEHGAVKKYFICTYRTVAADANALATTPSASGTSCTPTVSAQDIRVRKRKVAVAGSSPPNFIAFARAQAEEMARLAAANAAAKAAKPGSAAPNQAQADPSRPPRTGIVFIDGVTRPEHSRDKLLALAKAHVTGHVVSEKTLKIYRCRTDFFQF
jgi:hypothetical protein